MSRIACPSPSLFASLFCAVVCALALSACSGSRPQSIGNDAGSGSTLGEPCQFDTDCDPPAAICSTQGTCIPGCTVDACTGGEACNSSTGHCSPRADAGTGDGGTTSDGGTGTGDGGTTSDGGIIAAPTLCQPCTTNSDCQDNGLCISDPTHTYTYCTQDCTSTPPPYCPPNYLCTTDSTNSHHQCIPSGGACANAPIPDGGTGTGDGGTSTGGGSDGGVLDPNNPSTNGNGVDQCNGCNVNDDCIAGAICLNSSDTGADDGYCADACDPSNMLSLGPITIYTDCVSSECLNDVLSADLNDAVVDCGIDYSTCGPVDGLNSGSTANFCSAAIGTCGPASGF